MMPFYAAQRSIRFYTGLFPTFPPAVLQQRPNWCIEKKRSELRGKSDSGLDSQTLREIEPEILWPYPTLTARPSQALANCVYLSREAQVEKISSHHLEIFLA
jgi:hypothetical protein